MQQSGNGVVPPPMGYQQYQQQGPPPPYMMMMPPQVQTQWAPQFQAPTAGLPQQQQQQQQSQQSGQPTSADEIRTLWIGDLQYFMDENFLAGFFSQTGEVSSVKVIRNKQTGQIEGYGFIEFTTHAAAERVLQTFNGTPIPGYEHNFRLNWATLGVGEKRSDNTPDYTVFVGDLAPDVTDYMLQETFRSHYTSVKGAKVVIDRITGRTKGYGFVRFGDESEQQRAMTEMNGQYCSNRAMRVGPATNKTSMGSQQYSNGSHQNSSGSQNENDPNNTTIFVGGVDSNVTEDHLKQLFGPYGELVHVKIPVGKRCAFVQYAERSCAEEALLVVQGAQLGGTNIRLSWGHSPSNKQQPQTDQNQFNNSGAGAGYYNYGQGYENYGYALAPQDSNMYYRGYPGYGNYPQQQQQQQQHQQQLGNYPQQQQQPHQQQLGGYS